MTTNIDVGWSLNVQCDWEESLFEEERKAWLSFKHYDGKSVHDSVKKISHNHGGHDLVAKEGAFTAKRLEPGILEVVHKASGSCQICFAPDKVVMIMILMMIMLMILMMTRCTLISCPGPESPMWT